MLGGSIADFGKLIAEETEKWAKVVKLRAQGELIKKSGCKRQRKPRADIKLLIE